MNVRGLFGVISIFFLLISCQEKQPENSLQESIVVYGPSSMEWIEEAIGEDFQNKTGVELEFHPVSGMVGRLLLEKVAPKADVVLGLTPITMAQAKREGVLAPYKPANAQRIKSTDLIMDSDWYATPFDYGALAINYHTGSMPNPPATFEEIFALKNQLILPDPRSFTGQEFLLWTVALYGVDGWMDFWRSLRESVLVVTPSWDEAFAKFALGEASMMVGFATSDIYFAQEEGNQLDSFIPTNGGYLYQEGAALVQRDRIKDGAKAFIDYLLEDTFQSLTFEYNYMLPVTAVELTGLEEIPVVDSMVRIDPDLAATFLEEWQAQAIQLLLE